MWVAYVGRGHEFDVVDACEALDLWAVSPRKVEAVRSTHIHNTNQPYAIRHGDWVLVDGKGSRNADWEKRHGYPDDTKGPVELYNLKTDLAQKHNVAAEQPERVAELKALLKKIREQGHSAPRLAKP